MALRTVKDYADQKQARKGHVAISMDFQRGQYDPELVPLLFNHDPEATLDWSKPAKFSFRVGPYRTPGEVARDHLKDVAKDIRKKLRLLERFGTESPFKDGAVLAIDMKFPDSDKEYHYAAVVATDEKVWLTGGNNRGEGPYPWHLFVTKFLARGDAKVYFAQNMTEVGAE